MAGQQSPYMDVNTFLEKFYNLWVNNNHEAMNLIHFLQTDQFALNRRNKGHVTTRENMEMLANAHSDDFKSEESQELMTPILVTSVDPSQEASDFLEMANLLTVFKYNVDKHKDYDASIRLQTFLIKENRIKDPKMSYKMLQGILRKLDVDLADPRRTEILRMVAMHPLATTRDLQRYASNISANRDSPYYANAVEELRTLLANKKAQIREKADKERGKDFPNEKVIKDMEIELLGNVAMYIKDIIEAQVRTGKYSKDDLNAANAHIDEVRQEFNINNLMASNKPDYFKKYEEDLTLTVAQLRIALQKKDTVIQQQDVENKRLSNNLGRAQQEVHDAEAQIEKLTKEKTDLEEALKSDRTKIAALHGAIKIFVDDATKRANGSVFNKGNDLSEQIERFARQITALNTKQAQI